MLKCSYILWGLAGCLTLSVQRTWIVKFCGIWFSSVNFVNLFGNIIAVVLTKFTDKVIVDGCGYYKLSSVSSAVQY